MHRFLPRPHLFLTRTMLDECTSTYQVEELKSSNWMPWQRRMFAMLRQLGLDKCIANENVPGVASEGEPTEEIEAQV